MKPRRKLSEFLCKEMLFDYVAGNLDSSRRVAVEDALHAEAQLRMEIDTIRRGITYAQSLSCTEVRVEILDKIEKAESPLLVTQKYLRWSQWPDAVRWSSIAIVTSVFLAAIVMLLPVQKLIEETIYTNEIQVARIDRPTSREVEIVEGFATSSEFVGPPSPKTVLALAAEANLSGESQQTGEITSSVEEPAQVSQTVSVLKAPAEQAISKPVAKIEPVDSGNSSGASPGKNEPSSPVPVQASDESGAFVYRAYLKVSDPDVVSAEVKSKIEIWGGKKAGSVELGWKRGESRYFHFAIGEAIENQLQNYIKGLGPVRISRDPHTRRMPPGQVRYILFIEPAK